MVSARSHLHLEEIVDLVLSLRSHEGNCIFQVPVKDCSILGRPILVKY